MCKTDVDLYSCQHKVLRDIMTCKEWQDKTSIDPRQHPLTENPHFEHESITYIPTVCLKCQLEAAVPKLQSRHKAIAEQNKRDVEVLRTTTILRREQEMMHRREQEMMLGKEQGHGVVGGEVERKKDTESYPQRLKQHDPKRFDDARLQEANKNKGARVGSSHVSLGAETSRAQTSNYESKNIKANPNAGRQESSRPRATTTQQSVQNHVEARLRNTSTFSMPTHEEEAAAVKVLAGLEIQRKEEEAKRISGA